jgi:enoyl-CoA hydratase
MRADRLSALEQHGMGVPEAIANELRHGSTALAAAVEGAGRFAGGAGRHGSFADL